MTTLQVGTMKLALMSGLMELETRRWGLLFEVWTPLLDVSAWDLGAERTHDRHRTVNLWVGPFLVAVWRPAHDSHIAPTP